MVTFTVKMNVTLTSYPLSVTLIKYCNLGDDITSPTT